MIKSRIYDNLILIYLYIIFYDYYNHEFQNIKNQNYNFIII